MLAAVGVVAAVIVPGGLVALSVFAAIKTYRNRKRHGQAHH